MAAIVSGSSLGLLNSSLYVLGSQGALGQASQGRAGEQVFVNGSSGNLVIQNRDELVVGRGPDLSLLRTYNSQGLFDGDNNDNWRFGVYRKVYNLTGTVNTAGSTVTRVAEDGSESVYTFDATLGKYVCHDGGGSFDTLTFTAATQTWTWSWSDGTNQLTELYDNANGGRITKVQDQDGNGLTFTYNATGLITQVSDASGETTFLDYSGTNLTQLRTVNSGGQTLVRTRYAYDASNRLITVTTDLSPEDASIADGKTYVVSYTYDGTSKRVATLTQTDGNNLSFTYEQVGTVFRLKTYTDAANKTTTLQYTPGSATTVSTTAAANNAVLSTTETTTQTDTVPPYYAVVDGDSWTSITQKVYGVSNANAVAAFQAALPQPLPSLTGGTRITTVPPTITYANPSTTATANGAALSTTLSTNTNYNLNAAALTTPTVAWATAAVLAGTGTTAPTGAKTAFDQNGNGMAVWALGTDLFYSTYTKVNNGWSAAAPLDGSLAGSPTLPNLSMSANGNALVTWLQNGNIYARRFVAGAWDGATTIPNLENLTTTPQGPVGAINNNGRAVVVFLQPASGTTPVNLYANVYNGTAWAAAATAVDDVGTANANSITSTNLPSVAIDGNNNATVLWQQKKTSTQTGDSLFFSRYSASSGTWSTANNTTLTTAAVTAESIAFDGNGNGIAIWLAAGSLIAKSYTASTNTWSSTATTLSTATASTPSVSLASNGNGLVTWVQSNNVVARRYANGAWIGTAVESVEGLPTAALNPVGSINSAGQAAIAFLQPTSGTTNSLYVSRFSGGTWQAAVAVDDLSSANANNITGGLPSVAIDATGNVNTLWLQKSGAQAADSLFWNRFNADTAPYYTIPANASWSNIATALYGSAAPATQLQSALGNPPLTQNNRLTGFPATLTVTTTTTVPAYYTVQSGNTWSSIAQAVYGDVAAAGPLQAALSNQALTAGAMLIVPPSLSFTPATAAVNNAALSTTDTQTTNYSLNSAALTNPAGGWAAAVPVDSSTAAASQLLMGASNVGDGVSAWMQGGSVFASVYDTDNPVWTAPVLVSGSFTNISGLKLDVDWQGGNAIVTWIDATTGKVYANRGMRSGANVIWGGAQLVATVTGTLAEATGGIDNFGEATVVWRTVSGTTQTLSASQSWNSSTWEPALQVASGTVAITAPQVTISNVGLVQAVWRASDGTAESLFTRSYDVSVGSWGLTLALDSSNTPVSLFRIDTDIWGDTNVTWVQGNDFFINWGQGDRVEGWAGARPLASSPAAITQYAYSDSANNNVVAWITADGKVYANRWGASAPDLLGTGAGLSDITADINGPGQAVVSWRAGNDLYVTSFDGASWSTPALLESGSGVAATPRVAIGEDGQRIAVWVQNDGTADSIFASRYATGGTGAPYYTVPTGATWSSIAAALYGSSSVAGALQQAMGGAATPPPGQMTGFPATLTGTTTVTVPAYYLVPSGTSWANITQAVYGTSDANAQLALRDALGLGTAVPAAGTHLTTMPASIRYSGPAGSTTSSASSAALSTTIITTTTSTVPPYYAVQQGDSWSGIAQTVYGDSQAGSALQTALSGGATPTVGAHLVVPQSLTYDKTVSGGTRVDITDPLGLVSTMITDAQGQITQVLAPAVGGVRQSASYAYDANGNVTGVTDARGLVTTYGYDANGNRALERDAAGNTITRVFSSGNLLLAETSYVVPDPDGAGAGQPGTPLTARYAYDSLGHLRFIVSAEGRVSEYRYNSFGQRTAAIQYTGSLYNLTGLTPTSTLTEAQLNTFVSGADKTKTERVDSTYDFRGQLATATSYGKVDAAGVGVADADKAVTNYVYDQAGNLLNTLDARGSSTAYVYDGLGRLKQSTDATGRVTTTFFDDANKKTVLTNANGLATTSTYDAKGELISVLQSVGAQGLGTTSYFYDADGRLRRTVDPTVPTGVINHILYDEAGRKVATIDGNGTLTEYRYDADNNLTRTIQYATAVTQAGLNSLVDGLGNPTTVALASIRPAPSGLDRGSWNAYDSANQLVKSVDELGYITQMFYDGAGRITDVLKSAKAMASIAALVDTPTAASIAPATSDPLDRLTRNFYDADGKLRGTLDGEGYLVEYKYDAAGQLVETVGYATATNAGSRTTGTLAQLIPTPTPPTPPNPDDIHSYTLYNAKGQVVGVVDGEGYLTETVYDLAGNKTQVVRYATKVTYTAGATVASLRPAGNVQDRASSYTYTALNQVASATDPEGTLTQYTYDEVGNLTKSVTAASTADVRTSNAQYDKQGRLTAQLSGIGSALLTGGQTQAQIDAIWAANATKYTYDVAGRRTSSTDPNGNKTLYYYDADGHLTHTVNAAGEVKENKYNVLGQLTQSIAYGTRLTSTTLGTLAGGLVNATLTDAVTSIANAALDSVSAYTYTARGQVASSADPLQLATTNTYDAFGDLTGSSQQIGAGQTLDHSYAFDRRGLLTQTVWDPVGTGNPAGINSSQVSVYDAFGRSTQTTDANGNVRTRSYDRLGRTVSTTLDPGVGHLAIGTSATYDAFGRVLTQTDALGNATSYTYSTANRSVTMTTPELVSVTTVHNRQGETQSVTDGRGNVSKYDYDLDGNLKQVTRTDAQGQIIGTTINTYDKADRLTDAQDAGGNVVHYTYDTANRVLTRTVDPGTGHLNLTTTYEYDAKGQKTKVTDANNVLTQTAFDLKGQVTSVTVDPGAGRLNLTTTYVYDGKKTLTVTEGSGSAQPRVTKYTYDKLGRRIQEQVDPAVLNLTTTYTYDKNGNVVSKTEAAGKPEARTTRYVYDAADRLVWTIDALGDVTKNEYDAEGRVTRTIAYANALANFATLPAVPTAGDITSRLTAAALDALVSHVYDRDGREVYTIDALGDVRQRVYDAAGNVIQSTAYASPISVLASPTPANIAALVSTTNPNNQTTRTIYDAANRATFVIDAMGFVSQGSYDGNGNVIKEVHYANALQGTFVAGVAPQIVTTAPATGSYVIADALHDQTTRTVYDAAGRATFGIDAAGYVSQRFYDGNGNVIKEVRYANALQGTFTAGVAPQIVSVAQATGSYVITDALHDQTTRQIYDAAGRVFEVVNGEGAVTRNLYDALGNVTDKIEAAGLAEQRTTHSVYDAAGRLLEQTTAFGLPEAATSRFGYDALGDQTSDLDARGVDLAERDTAWAQAERLRLGYAKFASGLTAADQASLRALYTTTHTFDRLGRQLTATDPLGNTTRTDYDAFGNVVRAIDPEGNAGYLYYDQRNLLVAQVDPEGNLSEYEYDAAGNKTKTTRYAIPVSVPYDPSRPLALIRPKGLSLPGTSGSYAVTPDSPANSVTGDIDMRVLLTHDSWAPALAETFVTKDDLATNRDYGFRFASGSTGKLQFVGSPDGVTTFPNADNVTGGYSVVSTAATGFASGSTHWVRVTRSATTGQIKFYTSDDYDASTNTGTWTQLGDTIAAPTGTIHDGTSVLQVGSRIGAADNPLKGTIYYADVRKVIDGTGVAVVAKFDPSADAGSAGAASLTSSSSTHEIWTLSGAAAIVAGSPQDEITKTSYDALDRVTQIVDAEGHTELFGYDRSTSNVNFHQDQNANVTTYDYDAVGNKIAEHLPDSSVTRNDYDAFGNLFRKTEASGLPEQRVTQYVYDKNNRPVETVEPQVLTQQAGAAAPSGSLQLGAGTLANYLFAQTVVRDFVVTTTTDGPDGTINTSDQAFRELASSLTVSLPSNIGFGDGNIRVVWKLGSSSSLYASTVETTASPSATSVTLQAFDFTVDQQVAIDNRLNSSQVYEVDIYKGAVLITRSTGSYLWDGGDRGILRGTSTIPTIFNFSGQPPAGQSMHVAYWLMSDPNNLTEIDLKSYAPGSFSGFGQDVLSGNYGYEAKVFDPDGDALSAVTGTFTVFAGATSALTIQAQPLSSGVLQTPHAFKAYDAAGNVIKQTDAKGNATYFYYDANNRLIGTVNAERYLQRLFYDAAGNVLTERTYGDRIPSTVALTTLPDPAAIAGMNPANFRETTHRYDADNRLTETDTQAVLVYDRAGGLRPNPVPLVTTRQYDRNGNLVVEVDANGNKVYSYYDKADRKIARIDVMSDALSAQQSYLTTWTYDAGGNVIRQTRYATPLSAPITTASNVADFAAQAAAANNPDDRICVYAYDRMNRQIRETTLGVVVTTIDSSGAPTEQLTNVVIERRYDAVGNLTTQIQGAAQTDYSYDGRNRLYLERDPAYNDLLGVIVRGSKTITYDAVGNVKQVSENGSTTTYEYDPHGNVTREIDALGNPTQQFHDLNGNITVKHTHHINPDGTVSGVDSLYAYDNLNRQTSSTEARNFTDFVRYDAYGEIVAKGRNNLELEYEEYDKAGRLIKTNKDDGVNRAYLYDANGNQTAMIQSAIVDTDLKPLGIDQIARLSAATVQRTESTYDARNKLTAVYQAPTTLAAGPNVQDVLVDALGNPFLGGTMTPMQGGTASYVIHEIRNGVKNTFNSVDVSWPPIVGYGDGNIKIVWNTGNSKIGASGLVTAFADKDATSAVLTGARGESHPNFVEQALPKTYSISIYKQTVEGDVLITTVSGSGTGLLFANPTTEQTASVSSTVKSVLHFTGQSPDAQSLRLWLWPVGASQSTAVPVVLRPLTTATNLALPGHFVFDLTGTPAGLYNYEFKTYASPTPAIDAPYLDYVSGVTRLGTGGLGSPLSDGVNDANDVRVAYDAQGNGIAVWSQNDGGITTNVYFNRYVAATNTWQGMQLLENNDTGSASAPSIGMDAQGNATVVWGLQNSTTFAFDIYARRFVAGAWQPIQQLQGTGAASSRPNIAVDAQGNAIAAWDSTPDHKVYTARFVAASGAWQAPRSIPSNPLGSFGPGSEQLAIDAQGNATLVFVQNDSQFGTNPNIYASRYVAATDTWQTAQRLQTDGGVLPRDPQVVIDAQGNALAVWVAFNATKTNIYGNRYVAATGTWQGAQLLFAADASAGRLNPRAAFDRQGNAIVVCEGGGAFVNTYVAATGTWTGPQLLDALGGSPDIAFDSLGNATAVWTRQLARDPVTRTVLVQVVAARSTAGSSAWTVAQPVSDGTAVAQRARIVFDARDNPNVTWEQQSVTTLRFTLMANRVPATAKLVHTLQEVSSAPSSALVSIARSQSYNAFGEVSQEKDAAGHATNLTYNTRGDLVQKVDPRTSYTDSHGVLVQNFLPTTRYYYDDFGRAVGTMDPNLNKNTQLLDAAGHVLTDFHADGGKVQYGYDGFGNMRFVVNEGFNGIGERTNYSYDAKNQLTQVDHPTDPNISAGAARYDKYAYDEAGRRISHTNALNQTDLTYYDGTGRVTQTTNAAGLTTQYRYLFDAASGGIKSITFEPASFVPSLTMEDTKDYFGRLLKHVDLGRHPFTYTYNKAGWLIRQQGDTVASTSIGPDQDIIFTYYRNGLLKEVIDNSLGARSKYEYDQNGNRTFEGYARTTSAGLVYDEWSRAQYDELNRITRIDDPAYNIAYEYDALGNRRHVHASFTDGLDGTVQTQDYWYDYDRMNRFTVTQGVLADAAGNVITSQNPATRPAGTIVAGSTGTQVTYNKAGERTEAAYVSNGTLMRETYTYAVDGLLTQTQVGNAGGAPTGTGLLRMLLIQIINTPNIATRTYDVVGNVKAYNETGLSGTRNSTYEYGADGKISKEVNSATGESNYYYDFSGELANVVNVQSGTTVKTSYNYEYWDTAKQLTIRIAASNSNVVGWKPGFSGFTYDANGNLAKVTDTVDGVLNNGNDRSLTYALDAHGLVLRRNELLGSQTSRTQFYYYFNGVGVGDAGSFGPSRTDYASLLISGAARSAAKGMPIRSADFDNNFVPISDSYPAKTPGSYVLQAGDVGSTYDQTLRNVALALWGDGSLWYLLADANGLTADSVFAPGQVLVVPNVVTNVHNSSSTFKVYDAGEHIGDVSPTLPDPPPPPQPSKHGCGTFGIILMVVVAVVITAYLGPLATAYLSSTLGAAAGAVGYAAAAAVGSIASQEVGRATGNVDKFSWTQVGMAAIGGAVTGGLQGTNLAGAMGITNADAALAFNAAVANSLTQQIARGTGYQQGGFNWRSVAVSALAAPVAARVANFIQGDVVPGAKDAAGNPVRTETDYSRWAGDFGARLSTSVVTGVATAAIRRRLTGSGIDYSQIAADSFANSVMGQLAPKETVADREDADLGAAMRAAQRSEILANIDREDRDVGAAMRDVNPAPLGRGLIAYAGTPDEFGTGKAIPGAADASTPRTDKIVLDDGRPSNIRVANNDPLFLPKEEVDNENARLQGRVPRPASDAAAATGTPAAPSPEFRRFSNDVQEAWDRMRAIPEIAKILQKYDDLKVEAVDSGGSKFTHETGTVTVSRLDTLKQFRTTPPTEWDSLPSDEYDRRLDRMPEWRAFNVERLIAHEIYHSTQDPNGLRYTVTPEAYEQPALDFENKIMYKYFGQPYRRDVIQWRWAPWSGKP